jgi:alkylation response protein AidB-like acyl-CoA dehydrogenase
MYFALSPEQLRLQESVRAFVREHCDEATVRELMATELGYDPAAWKLLAIEVGVLGLGIPASRGGRGGELVDVAAVLEVLGESLFCGPYLSSVYAGQVAAAATEADPARAVLEGTDTITCALWPRNGDLVHATETADGVVLDGLLSTALDGALAGRFLVAAGTPDGDADDLAWYEVDARAVGVERDALPSLDQTRKLAAVRLAGAPARRLTLDTSAQDLIDRLRLLEQVAIAADQLGVARRSLQLAVEYAKQRTQFGRAIGAFQAVQHSLAEAALAVECAWVATYQAAWNFDHRPEELARAAALAAATAGAAALDTAELSMQVHAGRGFTWDNPAHLYLKRAKASRLLWGLPDQHRKRLAELIGL